MHVSRLAVASAAALAVTTGTALAAGPDLAIGDLFNTRNWGKVGDIAAYSIGTEVCNLGDEEAEWIANSPEHPVIAQNLYRHLDGRMEQIGMSWLKHGFAAINGNGCDLGCEPPGFGVEKLGVGCSDPYDATLNGDQDGFGVGGLGPRFEVNAATGVFAWPYTDQGLEGDAIYKRLQVHVDDIDNPGATYFIEAQYVTQDDAQAGNAPNNLSYREVRFGFGDNLVFEEPTVAGVGAIRAWQAIDPDVEIDDLDVANDGRISVASRAVDLGGGQWRYEYAVHNNTSHRSVGSYDVPTPASATITNVDFHDVDYHSGEPYDLTDWPGVVGAESVSWATDDFATNENANALRWGTMYNYRFEADAAPGRVITELGLFRPGTPDAAYAITIGPGNASGTPELDLAGACPGEIHMVVDGLTPGTTVAVAGGSGPGVTTIPQGVCAGNDLDIADAGLIVLVTADGDGIFSVSRTIGAGLCGQSIQTVDMTTCEVSNVLALP